MNRDLRHNQDLEMTNFITKRSALSPENWRCRKTIIFCYCLYNFPMGEAGRYCQSRRYWWGSARDAGGAGYFINKIQNCQNTVDFMQ